MISADNPWKEVCERKLPLVFALLYPDVHQELEWSQDYEALDQELRKFALASKARGRIADRLIKAFATGSGDPRFFHLEAQGKKERGFRRRIHLCNLRAEERFDAHVVSMVILTDENPTWRPRCYVSGLFPVKSKPPDGQAVATPDGKKRRQRYLDERTLSFLTVKLIDFRGREAELEALDNPMGLFVVAHLEALRTREDLDERQKAKLRLLRNLRQRKMDAEDVRFWESCFDWFLQLPKERDRVLWDELERLDKEQNLPFVSYAEQRGIEKGLEKGRGEGTKETLEEYLKVKFKEDAPALLALLEQVGGSEAHLKLIRTRLFLADSPDAVRAILAPPSDAPAAQS